jgi:hypothetical protein
MHVHGPFVWDAPHAMPAAAIAASLSPACRSLTGCTNDDALVKMLGADHSVNSLYSTAVLTVLGLLWEGRRNVCSPLWMASWHASRSH